MSFLQEYRNRPRRVVFYGRVSTEHEAQVSALDNQMDWYQELATKNPNWEVVGQYVDEGITGTQAIKRPAFMQMIEDAQSGKFDLVVTREVCRFARNTMDTLFYTRKLSKLGVEVYFAADSIWTMDNEGELRLTIMATMAQEESRKTSERVRAGIQMSREKGVLFGNGNILGYDLDKAHNTYVINEEQAETVRMIFEQYATGEGLGKVAKALIAKGRKDGGGHKKWDSSKITRILRNPTYMGYCVYNRTRTTDLLDHTREKNNDEETYILKKGNFTPIIDEELWHRCNDIRKSRQRNLLDENGKPRKYGGTVAKNVWVTKLVCHCGSKLRRYLWNTKADGTQVYGFECYRHKKQSALYLKKHGLPEGICELKAFPEWKLELMALKIFETVWGNRREAVLEACRMLNACYREESADPAKLKALEKRMDALNQRLDNLIMMKASNQITLSQFVEQSNEIGVQQQRVNKEKAELLAKQGDNKTLDMDAIEASLCEAVDFTDGMVSEWFIQNFVRRITPIDDTRFAWVLDLAPEPQTLVCEVNGRKEYPRITLESNLYRGAWPPPGASRQTFLINRNGRLNGDISAAGLAQDRLYQGFVLPLTETVSAAPGNGMCNQQHFQIGRIDAQQITAALHSGCCARIAVRHSKTPTLVIYKTVKGYFSFRTEIETDGILRNHAQLFSTYGFVNLLRRTIHSAAVGSVLFVAPFQRLPVEVCKITEHPVSQEIVLHKTHQSLHFSLGEGMPWLAKFCLEGKGLHKGFVVFLPDWMAIQISVQYNALHVVG